MRDEKCESNPSQNRVKEDARWKRSHVFSSSFSEKVIASILHANFDETTLFSPPSAHYYNKSRGRRPDNNKQVKFCSLAVTWAEFDFYYAARLLVVCLLCFPNRQESLRKSQLGRIYKDACRPLATKKTQDGREIEEEEKVLHTQRRGGKKKKRKIVDHTRTL